MNRIGDAGSFIQADIIIDRLAQGMRRYYAIANDEMAKGFAREMLMTLQIAVAWLDEKREEFDNLRDEAGLVLKDEIGFGVRDQDAD
jgi:hypothetical protein